MKKYKLVLVVLIALGVGAGIFALLCVDSESDPATGTTLGVRIGDKGNTGVKSPKKGSNRRVQIRPMTREEAKLAITRELAFDKDDEAALSAEQKALLEEIRRVLDQEDRAGLIRIVQKMQKSDEWPDGIPISIRKAAIDALAWFGHDCIPEILGFAHDPDAEIQQQSLEAYENALFEANGDLELSQLIIAAAKVVTDFDSIDSMMMWLNDMRPSRQVETIKAIWENGSDAAKRAVNENIEFITGEDGIRTPEDLDKWYNDPSGDNKDGDDAEEVFGPQKD